MYFVCSRPCEIRSKHVQEGGLAKCDGDAVGWERRGRVHESSPVTGGIQKHRWLAILPSTRQLIWGILLTHLPPLPSSFY